MPGRRHPGRRHGQTVSTKKIVSCVVRAWVLCRPLCWGLKLHTVLLSVKQDMGEQLATKAAALSDALQGSLQQAATQEWRVLEGTTVLQDAHQRLQAAQAQVDTARQQVLAHQAEVAQLKEQLSATRYYAVVILSTTFSHERRQTAHGSLDGAL